MVLRLNPDQDKYSIVMITDVPAGIAGAAWLSSGSGSYVIAHYDYEMGFTINDVKAAAGI
jgi:hypothetical protein